MSADEDTELRDLVAQTLETNGVLGKIRAQLRASVFLALEEQETVKNQTPLVNTDLKKFISTKEGRIVTNLVREFLEHFNLEFSLAVFEPESGSGEHYEGRNRLARDLNIIESSESTSQPLLSEVVQRCCGGGAPSRSRKGSGIESSSSDSIEARNKQNLNNNDKSASKTSPRSNSPTSPHSKDDSFFDDPIPKNDRSKSLVSDRNKSPSGGGLLGDLPSLGGGAGSTEQQKPNKGNNDLEKDIKAIDKKIADLGFDVPDDDYDDDDFESSNVSPFGVTPRSQKSDHNVRSIEEDLDEEIDEEFSVADDLLKSDNSGGDDLTTDRTISPVDQSGHFDYMEDVSLP